MLHEHISNLEASRSHLIGESRAFPNPGFDKLLDAASYEDLIWLDGAMSDQLDGLEHYVADPEQRREMFLQISDRLALVRHFAEMRGASKRQVSRHARMWTVFAMAMAAGSLVAGTVVAAV